MFHHFSKPEGRDSQNTSLPHSFCKCLSTYCVPVGPKGTAMIKTFSAAFVGALWGNNRDG